MELQAIRYAAMISTMTFDKAVAAHANYLRSIGAAQQDALRSIVEILDWDVPLEDEFARDVRIILVAAEFSKEITTAVMWLNERSLDIRCVRLSPCNSDETLFLDVQQVIPLPEAEEYQVRIREQSAERRIARSDTRDLTKYLFEGVRLHKRRLVLAVVRAYVRDHPTVGFEQLGNIFPGDLQGKEVFAPIDRAREIRDRTGHKRHLIEDDETIRLADRTEIAVSGMWGLRNLPRFLLRAKELGYEVKADGVGGPCLRRAIDACHSAAFTLVAPRRYLPQYPDATRVFPGRCLYQPRLRRQSRGRVPAQGLAAGSHPPGHRRGK
jgi:hypothetical protein